MASVKDKFNRRIPDESLIKEAYDLIDERFDGKTVQFFRSAIDLIRSEAINSDSNFLALSDSEQDEVNQAVKTSGLSLKDLMRRGLLSECRRENKQAEKREQFADLSDEELLKKTVRGVAEIRLRRALDAIIHHNQHATEVEDKFFINQRLLQEATGSNQKAVKTFYDANKAEIDKHHSSVELNDDNSRQTKKVGRTYTYQDLRADLALN